MSEVILCPLDDNMQCRAIALGAVATEDDPRVQYRFCQENYYCPVAGASMATDGSMVQQGGNA